MGNRGGAEFIGDDWIRLPWDDDAAMPSAGASLKIEVVRSGQVVSIVVTVVDSRPDFEPGWIQVEVSEAGSSSGKS